MSSGLAITPHPIDYRIWHAEQQVFNDYGHRVSVASKKKGLHRFGENPDIGTTEEEVWEQGGIEVLATGNLITHMSSSDATDTQLTRIEGHTISGSDLTFVVQTKALNGQNKVALDTPLYRTTQFENMGSTDYAGDVYLYEDDTVIAGVPQTAAKIHNKSLIGRNQSAKCATSLSSVDYWFINDIHCGVERSNNVRSVDFDIQTKEFGGVWKTRRIIDVGSGTGTIELNFNPLLIVQPNSDIRVMATSSGTSTAVEAILEGYLATII